VSIIDDHRSFGLSGGWPRQDIDPWRQILDWRRVITYLQDLPGFFFSALLDLDMSMLVSFWKAYTELDPGERGPHHSDATKAVLGDDGTPGDYWAPADQEKRDTQQERLRSYRFLFLSRSKPSTHLRALARLDPSDLKDGPESVRALTDYVKTKLGL